jgi:hypothetical protein
MTNPKAVALGLIVRCFAPLSEYHIGADQIMLAQIGADGRSKGHVRAFQPTAGRTLAQEAAGA